MNDSITNTANAIGTFDAVSTGVSSTIVTPMTEDLSIVKTANKGMWADGTLIYTVVVSNESTTLPYENVTFTDIIDPTLASLKANTVTLNGSTVAYTYDETTGLLTVTIGNIAAPGTATITFEIEKK